MLKRMHMTAIAFPFRHCHADNKRERQEVGIQQERGLFTALLRSRDKDADQQKHNGKRELRTDKEQPPDTGERSIFL